MTSNVGTRQLKDFGKGVGFALPSSKQETDSEYARGVIQKALNRTFAPEFLNRVDDVIMFDQLTKQDLFQIIDIELKGLLERINKLGFKIEITDEAKEFIAEKGYDVQFGARPLKRAIQKYVEDELAEMILKNEMHEGQMLRLGFDAENRTVKVEELEMTKV
jgi:ATP-dependent Clp protease ATP-binding subunit ClpC